MKEKETITEEENEGARWGIPYGTICNLGQRVYEFWERYKDCFKNKTRNNGEYALDYLEGLLRMETDRHFSEIGREAGVSGQNIQHFMSNSPWSGDEVCCQVLKELKAIPELTTGGVLLVDESCNEKAGDKSAGSAKQYNGPLGKLETSQVGVFFSYSNLNVPQGFWTWIKGKLYFPKKWFDEDKKTLRNELGIPNSLIFKTKIELAWDGIEELTKQDLPYEIVGFDSLYGRDSWLRANVRGIGKIYMAEVPVDTNVYLEKPELDISGRKGRFGPSPSKIKTLSGKLVRVDSLREKADWKQILVRTTERGNLCERFSAFRVWTVYEGLAVDDWLIIREESDGKYSYALCNASDDTSIKRLAWWKCQRYFIERSNQDAKSEFGWDEFQARKYLAWEHQLALTILASWFVAQTKYDFANNYSRDPELLVELKTDILPALSVANVRELLRAVMPLKTLTVEEATTLVIEHLINRTRSRRCRLRKQESTQQLQIAPS